VISKKPNNVFLTSYMRPEMTESSIKTVLNWNSLDNLVVVIDGLRKDAAESEKEWRKETIRITEKYANSNAKLDLWVYDSNIGITEHTMRIQGRALESGSSGIWLEEDISLELEKYSKIVESLAVEKSSDPILLSAYSHFNHNYSGERTTKGNLFLPVWGMVFNENFYNLISQVWYDKKFDEQIVIDAIDQVFPDSSFGDRLYKSKVVRFWTEYSRWGFVNSNRWDALANYALWTKSKYSSATFERLAHDLSFRDSRGMNQRIEPAPVQTHEFHGTQIGDQIFCVRCENWGSRIDRRLAKRMAAGIRYRLASKFN
jgi:hypothetical protein